MCSTRERLASTLRERRKELGLSLRRAAEHAQIGPSTLSRWEAGSSVPMVPELESLLKALYMSTEDIRRILVSIDAPRAMRAAQAAGLDFKVPTGGDLLRILRLRGQKTIPEVAEELGVSAAGSGLRSIRPQTRCISTSNRLEQRRKRPRRSSPAGWARSELLGRNTTLRNTNLKSTPYQPPLAPEER